MKKFFSVIICCVMFLSLLALGGCGEIVLKDGPAKTDLVTGNGSLTVRKGDYLYFVNGYVSNAKLSGNDNNYGASDNGAIYRAKLENGELMYDVKVNEDKTETKTLKNVELLVPKIAGFEYTSLHIYGESLFFTTPNTEKDNTGKIRFDLTDVFVVNINGGKVNKVANAINASSLDQIQFSYSDGKVYICYTNDNNLYNVRVSNLKVENATKVAESVSSFGVSSSNGYAYFTRSFVEGENSVAGNALCKLNLKTNEEEVIFRDNYNTFSIKKITEDKIYYSRTNSLVTNEYIYSLKLDNLNLENEKQYTIVSYSDNQYIYDLGAGFESGVITTNNNKLLLITGIKNPETELIELYDGSFTILGISNENVFGKDSNGNLVKVNIFNKQSEVLLSSDSNLDTEMKQNFDFDNNYVYYYVKYTGDDSVEGYYLNRLNLKDKTTELVGKLLDKHIKTEE